MPRWVVYDVVNCFTHITFGTDIAKQIEGERSEIHPVELFEDDSWLFFLPTRCWLLRR